MTGDNRPAIYREGDKWIYRASSFGNCVKELVATRVGFPPAPFPAKFDKIFADGNRGEDVIIAKLEARGFTITRRQEEINWEVLPGHVIRGHIDGVIEYLGDGPKIFDAKTTSAKYGIADHLMAKYELQVSIYGHALGLSSAVLGVGEKDPDTGDVMEVNIHTLDTLPVSKAQIVKRLHAINRAAQQYEANSDLPECDVANQWPCSQFALHEAKEGDDDPYGGFGVLEDDSLDVHLAEYLAAQQDEAEAKDRKANARKFIVQHVGGEGEARRTEKFELAWTGTGIRSELDKKALAKFLAAHEKTIDEFMGTKSVARSIQVKEIA